VAKRVCKFLPSDGGLSRTQDVRACSEEKLGCCR
jgi:hypothetical protein